MNRGSFDCSFLLLLCFCCFHIRKQRFFLILYGIYRRYKCLSKCRNDSAINNTGSFIFFLSFLRNFCGRELNRTSNVLYDKFDLCNEEIDVRAKTYDL